VTGPDFAKEQLRRAGDLGVLKQRLQAIFKLLLIPISPNCSQNYSLFTPVTIRNTEGKFWLSESINKLLSAGKIASEDLRFGEKVNSIQTFLHRNSKITNLAIVNCFI